MNHTKTTVAGIDVPIQRLQTYLYNRTKAVYGLTDADYEAFGRAYRNEQKGGTAPFFYSGDKQYGSGDLFYNDRVTIQTFFDIASQIKVSQDNRSTAKVMLLVFVDLEKLFGNAERKDEELRNFFFKTVNNMFGFIVTGIVIGAKDVLSEFSGGFKKDQLGKDIQPRHFFRIDMSLPNYDTNINYC